MAKLTLKLNGKVISSLELETGREYFVGRADECEFKLDDYRGISRQHLKIFESGGVWYCESLSKFLHPTVGSENFESLEMNESITFSLHPYDFEFEVPEVSQPISNEVKVEEPAKNQAMVPFDDESTSAGYSSEATAVGTLQLSSTLRIIYPSSSDNEILKLEGQVWTAGREPDCEIQLHNSKISRKHFELNKTDEGYFVTDLGSSNGTSLNGHKIPPHEPTRLMSGDTLKVLDVEIHFEIKASNLPAVTAQPLALATTPWGGVPGMNFPAVPGPYENEATRIGDVPSLEGLIPENATKLQKIKHYAMENKLRACLIAALPLLLVAFLVKPSDKGSIDQASTDPHAEANASFENLTEEEKAAIKDSLGLARNLYVQGKYSLCLAELAKLHETIPFYENSKELESFCIQGHELTQRKIDEERKEREKALVEQQITDISDTCKEKLGATGEVEEIRKCLAPAMELNPEHPKIIELIQSAEAREREKELLAQQQAEAAERRRDILSILDLARKYKDQGELVKARSTYKRFISQAGGGLSSEKETARRELSSVSENLQEKISLLMEKCRALGDSEKYKEAYQACDEAYKEDSTVQEAATLKEKYTNILYREMRVLYQDSKLEESLGNLDAAKEKWKKIRETDLEGGNFYKKATIKLRQYGAI